jgi:hypothetical protein
VKWATVTESRPIPVSALQVRTLACFVSLVAACALASTASAGPSAAAVPLTNPKVLFILASDGGIELTPTQVGAARYTVQVHNIGEYTVRVTLGRAVDVLIPPSGWRFRTVLFRPATTYTVRVVTPHHGLAWSTTLSSN